MIACSNRTRRRRRRRIGPVYLHGWVPRVERASFRLKEQRPTRVQVAPLRSRPSSRVTAPDDSDAGSRVHMGLRVVSHLARGDLPRPRKLLRPPLGAHSSPAAAATVGRCPPPPSRCSSRTAAAAAAASDTLPPLLSRLSLPSRLSLLSRPSRLSESRRPAAY
jgi:hypothetical protein